MRHEKIKDWEDRAEALLCEQEFERHLASLPIEEHEIALQGLREYEEHFKDDMSIVLGWEAFID